MGTWKRLQWKRMSDSILILIQFFWLGVACRNYITTFYIFFRNFIARKPPFVAFFFNFQDSCVIPQDQFLCMFSWLLKLRYCAVQGINICFFLTSGCILFISLKGAMFSILWKRFYFRSSPQEVFLRKAFLKICSKFTGGHPCRSMISIKLQNDFSEFTLRHGFSPVNLLHIFRTPLYKNTSGGLVLLFAWPVASITLPFSLLI